MTHQSSTAPEDRLAKKSAGKVVRLRYVGSVLMENRNGIIIDLRAGQATGRAECEYGLEMLRALGGGAASRWPVTRVTTTRGPFVAGCRALNVTPHVAQNERRPGASALDLHTTSWDTGSANECASESKRFSAGSRRSGLPPHTLTGIARTSFAAYLVGAAYNLPRIASFVPTNESSPGRAAPATVRRLLPDPQPQYSLRHRQPTSPRSRFSPFIDAPLGL